jgi:hypothetical protein
MLHHGCNNFNIEPKNTNNALLSNTNAEGQPVQPQAVIQVYFTLATLLLNTDG